MREICLSGSVRAAVSNDRPYRDTRVNHDVLMARLVRKVGDKRVLRLIRRYLQAGLMLGGVTTVRQEGTPRRSEARLRHDAGRCRRCCRISCSTIWTRSWNGPMSKGMSST